MKQTPGAAKPFLSSLVLSTALLFSSLSSSAQMSWPAVTSSITDNGYAASACNANERLNADLYNYYPSAVLRQLLVLAYDGHTSGSSQLLVIDRFGSGLQVALPTGSTKPDVVLGDDPSSPGDLIASVVYELGGVVYYDAYAITNLNTTLLACTQLGGMPVQLSSSTLGVTAQEPHIDMAPDPLGTPVWGAIYPLYDYVVTWAEGAGPLNAVAYSGNLNTVPTASPATQLIDNDVDRIDVALTVNTNTNAIVANFVYFNPMNNEVRHAEWDIATPTVTTAVLEGGVMVNNCPRIDAANITTNTILTTDMNWLAVAEIVNAPEEIHTYDNTGGTVTLTNYTTLGFTSNPLVTNNGFSPAVACGNGQATPATTTDIGNTTYTMGWYIDQVPNQNFYAVSVDIAGAGPTGYSMVPLANPVPITTASIAAAFAVSNGTNDGYDIATAWYNNSAVYWKFSGNAFTFKTTSVDGAFAIDNARVFPNPATNLLTVQDVDNAEYTISNITGSTLLKGSLDNKNNSINIADLTAGMYFLNVSNGLKKETVKFVKE